MISTQTLKNGRPLDNKHSDSEIKTAGFLKLCLVKVFNAIITTHNNFCDLKKKAFLGKFCTVLSLTLKYDFLTAVVPEETGGKPKKPVFWREKSI